MKKGISTKKTTNPLPFSIIKEAVDGNPNGLEQVKKHYKQYIKKFAVRRIYDGEGQIKYYIDENMFEQIENSLIEKIMYFKIKNF